MLGFVISRQLKQAIWYYSLYQLSMSEASALTSGMSSAPRVAI